MGKKEDSENFSSHMMSVLKNSKLTGIPQIVGASSTAKRVTRALVFVLCIGGFIYQAQEFLEMYWQYKVLLDVRVETTKEVTMPAITVCNIDAFRISPYMKDHPDEARNMDEERLELFCNCTPRYCDEEGRLLKPIPENYGMRILSKLPPEKYRKYLQKLDKLLVYCEEFGMNIDEFEGRKCNLSNYVSYAASNPSCPGCFSPVCYTINTLVEQPDGKPETVMSSASIKLTIDTQPMESNPYIRVPSFFISFHSPFALSNPFLGIFAMYADKRYNYRMKKIMKKALPAPYETNCTDYIKLWKERGGFGPTNAQDCVQECYLNMSLQLSGCVPDFIDWPHNYKICDRVNAEELFHYGKVCGKEKCQVACWEEGYDVQREERDREDLLYNLSYPTGMRNDADVIEITVYFNNMETTIYSYKPQFESIETFSYVGGYVGMWLGISLLALFDFVESLVDLLNYPFSGKKKLTAPQPTAYEVQVRPS